MAHDWHFLQRLGRAGLPQAELALSLYHDAALTREVLAQAGVDEQVEQVAVCLDAGELGPYVVVTRGGRFVTCLAAGMVPNPQTPIVAHRTLQRAATRIEQLRTQLALLQNLKEEPRRVNRMIRRLYQAGDEVSREDILALQPLQPLLGLFFFTESFRLGSVVLDLYPRVVRLAEKPLHPKDHAKLRTFFNSLWGSGHLLALACCDSVDWLPPLLPRILSENPGAISWLQVRVGFLPVLQRALWAIARLGKLVLPAYKQAYLEANTERSLVNGGLGLAAIGLRHGKLRAEVRKCFPRPHLPKTNQAAVILDAYVDAVNVVAETAFELMDLGEEECLRPLLRELGQQGIVQICATVPSRDGRPQYATKEEVPDEIAFAALVHLAAIVYAEPQWPKSMAFVLPWLARSRLEDLYFPRSYLEAYHTAWSPEQPLRMVQALNKCDARTQKPVHRAVTPGRNEPCSCGSGRKYKKCCGR